METNDDQPEFAPGIGLLGLIDDSPVEAQETPLLPITMGDIVRGLSLVREFLETDPSPERLAAAVDLIDALEFRIVSDAVRHNVDLNKTALEFP